MSDLILKTKEDINHFLTGCAFLGTGGGGEVSVGRDTLYKCLEKGTEIRLTDPEMIEDEETYCCAFFMGSIAPKTDEILKEMDRLGYKERTLDFVDMLVGAVRSLETILDHKIDGLYIAEPGGSNAACCMAAAYKLGIPIFDGDPAGRAIPEMTNGLFSIYGKSCLPIAYCDSWGNQNATINAMGYPAVERIGKFLSEASYGEMAEAAYSITGKELKDLFVFNSLTKAYEIGKCIHEFTWESKGVQEKGSYNYKKMLQAVAKTIKGSFIGTGTICNFAVDDTSGYYSGTFEIKGEGGEDEYKVWFKNENHILWVNGIPKATSPDLITLINLKDGEPLLNSHLKNGLTVGIIVSSACEKYLTEKGIASFGPRYFGFDFDYVNYKTSL